MSSKSYNILKDSKLNACGDMHNLFKNTFTQNTLSESKSNDERKHDLTDRFSRINKNKDKLRKRLGEYKINPERNNKSFNIMRNISQIDKEIFLKGCKDEYFSPKICKKSKSMEREIDDLYKWKNDIEKKQEMLREFQLTKKMADFAPKIHTNQISNKLLENHRPKGKVEDLLISKGYETKRKINDLTLEIYGNPRIPKITAKAAKLRREQKIHNRLYKINKNSTNESPNNEINSLNKEKRNRILSFQSPKLTARDMNYMTTKIVSINTSSHISMYNNFNLRNGPLNLQKSPQRTANTNVQDLDHADGQKKENNESLDLKLDNGQINKNRNIRSPFIGPINPGDATSPKVCLPNFLFFKKALSITVPNCDITKKIDDTSEELKIINSPLKVSYLTERTNTDSSIYQSKRVSIYNTFDKTPGNKIFSQNNDHAMNKNLSPTINTHTEPNENTSKMMNDFSSLNSSILYQKINGKYGTMKRSLNSNNFLISPVDEDSMSKKNIQCSGKEEDNSIEKKFTKGNQDISECNFKSFLWAKKLDFQTKNSNQIFQNFMDKKIKNIPKVSNNDEASNSRNYSPQENSAKKITFSIKRKIDNQFNTKAIDSINTTSNLRNLRTYRQEIDIQSKIYSYILDN